LRPGGAGPQVRQEGRRGAGAVLPRPVPAGRRRRRDAGETVAVPARGAQDKGAGVLERRRRRRQPRPRPLSPGPDATGISARLTRLATLRRSVLAKTLLRSVANRR